MPSPPGMEARAYRPYCFKQFDSNIACQRLLSRHGRCRNDSHRSCKEGSAEEHHGGTETALKTGDTRSMSEMYAKDIGSTN